MISGGWRYPSPRSLFFPAPAVRACACVRARHCRVECKFLTLKISWHPAAFGDRRVPRKKSMFRRVRRCEQGGCKVRSDRTRERKNRSPERKDYIGDFGFRVSSGPKPISPIFRLSGETREPALELDVHCTRREASPRPYVPRPLGPSTRTTS